MANTIKIGNIDISSFKVGSSDCSIYLGTTLLYSGGTTPPTPPTFDGKWLATYDGGTTSSAECDSTSAITSGEINLTNLVGVEIGDCVTSIGESAFDGCESLSSVTIPNGITSIGDYAFSDCNSLTSVTIPNSVTTIGENAFSDCDSLTSCTIGSGVTSIGENAFNGCDSLTSVTIGSGVTSIGNNAFRSCMSLQSITVEAVTPPALTGAAFEHTNECPIYVPAESVSAYQSDSGWSYYESRIQPIPNS